MPLQADTNFVTISSKTTRTRMEHQYLRFHATLQAGWYNLTRKSVSACKQIRSSVQSIICLSASRTTRNRKVKNLNANRVELDCYHLWTSLQAGMNILESSFAPAHQQSLRHITLRCTSLQATINFVIECSVAAQGVVLCSNTIIIFLQAGRHFMRSNWETTTNRVELYWK
jgi:mRNA-degrading endonuclease toxin of MazEF toxin-antitoxin module